VITRSFSGHSQYELGGPDEITLNELAETVGWQIHGTRIRILHIPIPIGFFIARMFAFVLSKPPITASNSVGMNEVASVEPGPFFIEYDFHPRTFINGLAHIKKIERDDKTESGAILEYVFSGRHVTDFYVDLYEKALAKNGLPIASLDAWLVRNRLLLGAFDTLTKFTRSRGTFQKKLLIAAAIIESTPASSEIFLPKPRTLPSILFICIAAGFSTILQGMIGGILFIIPKVHSKNA